MRTPYRVGRARGFRYGEIPVSLERALPRWLAARRVEDGQAIKAGSVYRSGPWLVKFSGASRALKDMLRPSVAIRVADLHERLLPVRTPRPCVALEERRGPFLAGSLLVTEFVEGATMHGAWGADAGARATLASFLARLHERGVFHGDLHPDNLIWTGSEWVLIDLESLRHPLRSLARRRLALEQWARLVDGLGPQRSVRECFERYVAERGLAWDVERAWSGVLERVERIRRARTQIFERSKTV